MDLTGKETALLKLYGHIIESNNLRIQEVPKWFLFPGRYHEGL
jgi:hypothetical protein